MRAKEEQIPATNANPVLSVDKNGTILYSNEAGNTLLNEWDVRVGEKLPSNIGDFVQRVISRNSPEKMEVKVENKVYLVVFSPLLEQERIIISGFDISDQKELEKEIHKSEAREVENIELEDIIDIPAIQYLVDDLYKLTNITIGLVDLKGNVSVIAGQQDICSKFHRVHPETCKHCIESDTKLSLGVAPAEFKMYKCKNNMWDLATPLIMEGQRIGNIISGQFFFDDETLDYELFRSQARKYGFNEEEYIAALEKVPRLSREAVNKNMSFFMKLANMFSQLSHSNFKLAQSLVEREILVEELRKSEERFRSAFDDSAVAMALVDPNARLMKINQAFCQLLGFEKSEMESSTFLDFTYPDDIEPSLKMHKAVINREMPFFWLEKRYIRKDGRVIWCEVSSSPVLDSKGCPIYTIAHIQDITERKDAEEALKKAYDTLEEKVKERTAELVTAYSLLKESEKGLAEAQRMAHIGNWNWNLITGEVYWSDEMYRIFGLNPQEPLATYTGLLNYIHPDDRDYVDNANKKRLKGEPIAIDHRIILANGEERTVHSQAEIIFDEENKPIRLKGIVQDITEYKKAEEKIERLANIVEYTNDGIGLITPEGIVLEWNKGEEHIYGYDVGDIVGRHISVLAPPHMKNEPMDHIELIKQTRTSYNYTTSRLRKDGKTIEVSITLAPVFDNHGKLTAISFITRDITEQKMYEERLRLSEEKYRNIVETANEGITTTSSEGVITYANKKMAEMLGYTIEEIVGRTPWDFVEEEDKPKVTANLERRHRGINETFDFKLRRKNGSPLFILTSSRSFFDENGKFIGYLNMHTDITKRKEAEEALANIEIARQKEIHHRIKNNLQVISSLLDLQADKFNNREYIKYSEILEAFKESQNRVISMALIHEELHKGERLEMLNFSSYIKELADSLLLTYTLGNKAINLNMDLDHNIFFDMDIAIPLGIIINELVSNSLKHAFSDRENGEIQIKLYREENEEREARYCKSTCFTLTISDNGVGIPEDLEIEDLDSLGLQLVTTLVDQLDGELEMKRDNGTEFIIRFTVKENDNQISAPAAKQLME